MKYFDDKTFEGINFQDELLEKGEYEFCVFRQCDLSNIDLSEIRFTDCDFMECNLSVSRLKNTSFRDVKFKSCKMLGLHFDDCNEFGLSFSFDSCQLNHSSFYKTKIKSTVIRNSQLIETDFSGCDLSNAVFDNCELTGAIFENTNLEKADLSTSQNYTIDPETNRIKKARFSAFGLAGLLTKYDIVIENTN